MEWSCPTQKGNSDVYIGGERNTTEGQAHTTFLSANVTKDDLDIPIMEDKILCV